jgi:isopentenyl diphosphate isomerase/L-lactate dehydrogenase-like FMN-dependent dehydrogenase
MTTANQWRLPRWQRFGSFAEAEALARRRLPQSLYRAVLAGRAGRGVTARENIAAFDAVRFRPRAAVYNVGRDLSTTVLGEQLSLPVILAPVGHIRLVHPDGAIGAARAAAEFGTVCIVSMVADHATPEVRAVAPTARLWQQLYLSHGRETAIRSMGEGKAAGATALVVTVDCPVRHSDPVDLRVSLDTALVYGTELIRRPLWSLGLLRDGKALAAARDAVGPHSGESATWDDLAWIKETWDGPLVVKGIVRGEDAKRAIDCGASAVVVSNHGGLVLDGAPATLTVLPEVLQAVGSQADVLLDGGVRQGTDVVKALALGAKAVLIGRPYIAGLAVGGAAGVHRMLEIFQLEVDRTLAMIGVQSVGELNETFVELPAGWSRV